MNGTAAILTGRVLKYLFERKVNILTAQAPLGSTVCSSYSFGNGRMYPLGFKRISGSARGAIETGLLENSDVCISEGMAGSGYD